MLTFLSFVCSRISSLHPLFPPPQSINAPPSCHLSISTHSISAPLPAATAVLPTPSRLHQPCTSLLFLRSPVCHRSPPRWQVRFEKPGSHSLEVLAICTAYLGADVRSDLNVEILEPAKNMKKMSAQGGRGGEIDSDDDSSDEYDDESSEGSDASE